jgi:hypothetical protein
MYINNPLLLIRDLKELGLYNDLTLDACQINVIDEGWNINIAIPSGVMSISTMDEDYICFLCPLMFIKGRENVQDLLLQIIGLSDNLSGSITYKVGDDEVLSLYKRSMSSKDDLEVFLTSLIEDLKTIKRELNAMRITGPHTLPSMDRLEQLLNSIVRGSKASDNEIDQDDDDDEEEDDVDEDNS